MTNKQPTSYEPIPPADVEFIAAASERIRLRMKRTSEDIIEIGKDMIEVKKRINHGQFGFWLENEFEMTVQHARRFMKVADRFGDKTNIMFDFKPTVLCELAAPSTPDEVVEKAQDVAASGEKVTVADVKQWKDDIQKLKKQHREKQDSLKTKVATLQLDLENRTDRNAELTRELQEHREEKAKAAEKTRIGAEATLKTKMAEQTEKFSRLQEENQQLQNSLHEALRSTSAPTSPEPTAPPGNVEIFVPQQPTDPDQPQVIDRFHRALDDIATVISSNPLATTPQDLTHLRDHLLRTATVTEEIMTAINQPFSQWGE